MKIVHVINSLHFGGAEKLLRDTIPRFKGQGIAVDAMVLYNEKTVLYKELEDSFKVRVIAPKKLRSLYSFFHIFWLRKYVKQYDIVHVHLFPTLYWVVLATLFLKKKPVLIATEHNTDNRRRSSFFLRHLDTFMYKKYDKIIAISEAVKENLETHLSSDQHKINLINNGVDTKLFQEAVAHPKQLLNVPEKSKVIIQVSSFFPQKDHDTLLKAVSLLPNDVHLLLVGYGILINEKKALATSLKIDNRVHFLGYRKDIPKLLKTADICVLSSNYEGFGLAIVEGMASGLPCVGSDVDGLSQVIGDAGILFERGNHIQLKEELNKLLSNKEYCKEVSSRCLDRAREYDISIMIEAHINVYNELLN